MVMVKMGIFVVKFRGQYFRLAILTMENLDFGRGHGRNFDHLTMVVLKFWPWSWSKIFDHMTMTPGPRPNGQKIMVALPPPPPNQLGHEEMHAFSNLPNLSNAFSGKGYR